MSAVNAFKTSYLILKESALIVESYEGLMTFETLLKHKKQLSADPSFDTSFDVLTDLRKVTDSVSDTELLSFLANTKGVGLCGTGKNAALIASSKPKSYNESFGKLSSFLSIDYNYSTSLEQLLDYLDHKDLMGKVSRFLQEKNGNKDYEWVVESTKKHDTNIFKRISQSIKSRLQSKKVSNKETDDFKVEYKIYPERCLIVESYSGIVTLDDLGYHAHILAEDPYFDNSYDHLLDVRNVFYKMNMNDLVIFAEISQRGEFVENKKFGVWIATQNQLEFNKMFAYIFAGFSLESRMSKKLDELLDFTNQQGFKSEIIDFFERDKK